MSKYKTGNIQQDRIRAIFIGGAAGDAIGGPFNHLNMQEFLLNYPTGVSDFHDYPRTIDGKHNKYWRPAGSYTDDTQQTLVVAKHLTKNGRLVASELAKELTELVMSDGYRGGGRNSKSIFSRIKGGTDYRKAGSRTADTTGSLMRDSPIAAFLWTDKEQLRAATIECSMISHQSPDAVSSCLTFSRLIQLSMDGYPTETQVDHFRDPLIERYNEEVIYPFMDSVNKLSKVKVDDKTRENIAAYKARIVSAQAMDAFSKSPNDFRKAMGYATTMSRDRDTCAKLTGELIGARHGIGVIPTDIIEGLENYEEILKIADDFYAKHVEVFGYIKPTIDTATQDIIAKEIKAK